MIIIVHKPFRVNKDDLETLKNYSIPTRTWSADNITRAGTLLLRISINSQRATLQFIADRVEENCADYDAILRELTFKELLSFPLWSNDQNTLFPRSRHIYQIGGAIFARILIVYDDYTNVTVERQSSRTITTYDGVLIDIEDNETSIEDFIIKYGGRVHLLNITDYEALDINFKTGVIGPDKKLYFGLYSKAPEFSDLNCDLVIRGTQARLLVGEERNTILGKYASEDIHSSIYKVYEVITSPGSFIVYVYNPNILSRYQSTLFEVKCYA